MDIGSLLNQAGGVSTIARQLGVDEATVERGAGALLPHVANGVETQGLPGVEDAGSPDTGGLGGMLPLVLMFVVLYFVMIRPQMKRQKEHKAMIDALAKGDEVVTSGGVLGKVSKMGDTFVGVEVANGVEIQVQRSAVVQVMPKGTVK